MLTTQWGSNTWSNPFLRFMMMAEVTERSRRHRDANSRPQLCFLCFLDDVCYLISLKPSRNGLVDGIDDSPKNDVIIYFSAAPWRWQVTWGSAAARDINLQIYVEVSFPPIWLVSMMMMMGERSWAPPLHLWSWELWKSLFDRVGYHGTWPRSPATSRIS